VAHCGRTAFGSFLGHCGHQSVDPKLVMVKAVIGAYKKKPMCCAIYEQQQPTQKLAHQVRQDRSDEAPDGGSASTVRAESRRRCFPSGALNGLLA
jgi:hypothetical protein